MGKQVWQEDADLDESGVMTNIPPEAQEAIRQNVMRMKPLAAAEEAQTKVPSREEVEINHKMEVQAREQERQRQQVGAMLQALGYSKGLDENVIAALLKGQSPKIGPQGPSKEEVLAEKAVEQAKREGTGMTATVKPPAGCSIDGLPNQEQARQRFTEHERAVWAGTNFRMTGAIGEMKPEKDPVPSRDDVLRAVNAENMAKRRPFEKDAAAKEKAAMEAILGIKLPTTQPAPTPEISVDEPRKEQTPNETPEDNKRRGRLSTARPKINDDIG